MKHIYNTDVFYLPISGLDAKVNTDAINKIYSNYWAHEDKVPTPPPYVARTHCPLAPTDAPAPHTQTPWLYMLPTRNHNAPLTHMPL